MDVPRVSGVDAGPRDVDRGGAAQSNGEARNHRTEDSLDRLALGEIGISFLLVRQRRLLAESGKRDSTVAILDQVAPMLLGSEACLIDRPIERADHRLLLGGAEILRIELFPSAVETVEFGAAGRQKGKAFQTLVVGKKGEHLLFELRPGDAGDDGDLDDSEQPAEEPGHIDLLCASVPSRSNITRVFIIESGTMMCHDDSE